MNYIYVQVLQILFILIVFELPLSNVLLYFAMFWRYFNDVSLGTLKSFSLVNVPYKIIAGELVEGLTFTLTGIVQIGYTNNIMQS